MAQGIILIKYDATTASNMLLICAAILLLMLMNEVNTNIRTLMCFIIVERASARLMPILSVYS